MKKDQLVRALIPAFQKRNPGATIQQALDGLYAQSTDQLQKFYAEVNSELTPLEEQTIQAVAELAAERTIRQLRDNQAEQQRKKEGREVFTAYAKQFGVADVDANFELLWQALAGESFDTYNIQKAVNAGLQLAPASREQLARWMVEAEEKQQDWLKNHATSDQLREHAAQQSEDTRRKSQQAFLDHQLALRTEREAFMGFPPLPPTVTKEHVYKMSGEEMRKLVKRHGFAMVEKRLQGKG